MALLASSRHGTAMNTLLLLAVSWLIAGTVLWYALTMPV
jgi:hypothetical protein